VLTWNCADDSEKGFSMPRCEGPRRFKRQDSWMKFLPGMLVTTVRFVCDTSPDPVCTEVSARLWSGLHALIWSWRKESRGAALLFHGTAVQTPDQRC